MKITARKKILHKAAGQNHFLAKKSGWKKRGRKNLKQASLLYGKKLKELLPYHLM